MIEPKDAFNNMAFIKWLASGQSGYVRPVLRLRHFTTENPHIWIAIDRSGNRSANT